MPRPLVVDCGGKLFHTLNRGNARNNFFFKEADYEALERIVSEGLEKYPADLIAYQWMSNDGTQFFGAADRAEDYRWGNLWNWCSGDSLIQLIPWPIKRLPHWIEPVLNDALSEKETDALRSCIQRGCPFGGED